MSKRPKVRVSPPSRRSAGRSFVAVPGQGGQRLALLGLEEGVGEGDGVDARHPWVLVELGVDVEEHGHVHLLLWV